jgi:hypothetical protein
VSAAQPGSLGRYARGGFRGRIARRGKASMPQASARNRVDLHAFGEFEAMQWLRQLQDVLPSRHPENVDLLSLQEAGAMGSSTSRQNRSHSSRKRSVPRRK